MTLPRDSQRLRQVFQPKRKAQLGANRHQPRRQQPQTAAAAATSFTITFGSEEAEAEVNAVRFKDGQRQTSAYPTGRRREAGAATTAAPPTTATALIAPQAPAAAPAAATATLATSRYPIFTPSGEKPRKTVTEVGAS